MSHDYHLSKFQILMKLNFTISDSFSKWSAVGVLKVFFYKFAVYQLTMSLMPLAVVRKQQKQDLQVICHLLINLTEYYRKVKAIANTRPCWP